MYMRSSLAAGALLVAGTATAQTAVPTDLAAWNTDTTKRSIELAELIRGCPSRDCIRSIDEPAFQSIRAGDDWLDDRSPVAVVRQGTVAKAYPLQILAYHEIVNDEVAGIPVTVTYCPLCNTTVAFDRRLDGRTMDFGVSGFLRHSDLVMYDRQTETLWQQAVGKGVVGEQTGAQLRLVPAPVMSWKDFKESEPNGVVLSRETGADFDYSKLRYAGYDSRPGPIARFFGREPDRRLDPMERVVGIGVDDDGAAVPFAALAERGVITTEVGGEEVVVFWSPGTATVLDAETIEGSKDIGAAGVFRTTVNGRRLRFQQSDDGQFTDRETGSTWTITGRASRGPMAGTKLEAVPYTNAFWFAWGSLRPETRIVRR